jgi:uncharacterized protein (DUF2132 family)
VTLTPSIVAPRGADIGMTCMTAPSIGVCFKYSDKIPWCFTAVEASFELRAILV